MGRRRLIVSQEFLAQMFTSGAHAWVVTGNPMPSDLAIVDVRFFSEHDVIHLIVESREFSETLPGEVPTLEYAIEFRNPDAIGAWCPVCERGSRSDEKPKLS